MLLNNTAQPTIVIPRETEQRVEQGGHNLQRLPKTLTFIEYGGSWPGPQEEARSPQFFFFCSRPQIQLKLQLAWAEKSSRLCLLATELAVLPSPQQREGKGTNCPLCYLRSRQLSSPLGGVETLFDKNVPSLSDISFFFLSGGVRVCGGSAETNEVTPSRKECGPLCSRASGACSPGRSAFTWGLPALLEWQPTSRAGELLVLCFRLGRVLPQPPALTQASTLQPLLQGHLIPGTPSGKLCPARL